METFHKQNTTAIGQVKLGGKTGMQVRREDSVGGKVYEESKQGNGQDSKRSRAAVYEQKKTKTSSDKKGSVGEKKFKGNVGKIFLTSTSRVN